MVADHSFLRSAEHSGKLIAGNNPCHHIFFASISLSFPLAIRDGLTTRQ
jgi:hypothetical protein